MSQTTTTTTSGRKGFPSWLIAIIAIVVVLAIIILPIVAPYNGLVRKRNAVKQQYANVEVQLQRRYDLIPNLVSAVQGTMAQERAVFGDIAQARTKYSGANTTNEKVQASNQMEGALSRLLVVMEKYPQLQSNQTVRDLMTQLEGTENRISQERRMYNDAATDYNNTIQTFPRNITAALFSFKEAELFKTEALAKTNPKVDLGVTPTTAATTPTTAVTTTAVTSNTTATPTTISTSQTSTVR